MPDPEALRLFIALELPPEWKSVLQEEQRRLETAAPGFGRWVAPDLMHLTLLFLGNQEPSQVGAVEMAMDAAASAASRFELHLTELGSFGSPRSLRVVWAGVRDAPAGSLSGLQEGVVAATRAQGIQFDQDRFAPHVTLARARRDSTPAQAEAMSRALAARADWGRSGRASEAEPYPCRQIALVHSDLRASGPLYTTIHRAAIAD
jgi:2'-5' RNA ligase